MKTGMVFVLVLLFAGCAEDHKPSNLNSHPADSLKGTEANIDIHSMNNTADLAWVNNLYSKKNEGLRTDSRYELEYFKILNDSVSYCIFQLSDNTCLKTFLASQVHQQEKNLELIADECDADLSISWYSYSSYELDSVRHLVKTIAVTETADADFLIKKGEDDHFKEGYNMENAKTTMDTVITQMKIEPSGKISLLRSK